MKLNKRDCIYNFKNSSREDSAKFKK